MRTNRILLFRILINVYVSNLKYDIYSLKKYMSRKIQTLYVNIPMYFVNFFLM